MALTLDTIPEELRLLILSFVPPSDLWLHVRHINPRYEAYAEDVASLFLVSQFKIGLNFALGSGDIPRWYEIRGTVEHKFKCINRLNPQYALFETNCILPKDKQGPVLESWKRMCASGFGPMQEWRVTFNGTGLLMKMPKLVLSESNGVFCDWRELLDGYFARLPAVWEGLARPYDLR